MTPLLLCICHPAFIPSVLIRLVLFKFSKPGMKTLVKQLHLDKHWTHTIPSHHYAPTAVTVVSAPALTCSSSLLLSHCAVQKPYVIFSAAHNCKQ